MIAIRQAAIRLSWKLVPFKPAIKPVVHRIRSSRLMPGCWLRSFRLYRILAFGYGYLKSAAAMRSIDATGNPLPWITYPAIAFLMQLDLTDKKVFEYGCGGSTLFWGAVARQVDSVEDNEPFYREVRRSLPENCHLSLERYPEEYIRAIERGGPYDIIVIDGHSRVRCSEIAPRHLEPGGFIILDNSDWFHEASSNLRDADLIEVDMAGMSPIADFVSTTSFYFHREFRAKPRGDRQPVGAIGSRPKPNFPRVTGPAGPTPSGHG